MLTRCPACTTHFRVTPEQLKARTGRVRCGECQNVFNALDSLIEEPVAMSAPAAAAGVPPAPTPGRVPEVREQTSAPPPEPPQPSTPELRGAAGPQAVGPLAEEPAAGPPAAEPGVAGVDRAVAAATDADDWSITFPEPPPPPRRWPWVIGSLVAFAALVLQALLAFRVELAVLLPEVRPALVALCDIADCDVGLPTKIGLVGIEGSDLHPDGGHQGRLVLTATLKNRAPFAQQFPHLELTLTDTADQTIARKVLAPMDYLPPATSVANGMRAGADVTVTVGIDSDKIAASGYRLYVFYP